jgi:hypothetical protein
VASVLAGRGCMRALRCEHGAPQSVFADVPNSRRSQAPTVSSQTKRLAGKPVGEVLEAAVCAVTCDANGTTAIGQRADLDEALLVRFGLARGRFTRRIRVPSEKTLRAVSGNGRESRHLGYSITGFHPKRQAPASSQRSSSGF